MTPLCSPSPRKRQTHHLTRGNLHHYWPPIFHLPAIMTSCLENCTFTSPIFFTCPPFRMCPPFSQVSSFFARAPFYYVPARHSHLPAQNSSHQFPPARPIFLTCPLISHLPAYFSPARRSLPTCPQISSHVRATFDPFRSPLIYCPLYTRGITWLKLGEAS